VELIDEGKIWGGSAEHLKARLVVIELDANRRVVKSPGWQRPELADLGYLVRGEDRDRGALVVRDAIAQLPFASLVIGDRLID